jgi:hypothetical protein
LSNSLSYFSIHPSIQEELNRENPASTWYLKVNSDGLFATEQKVKYNSWQVFLVLICIALSQVNLS